MERPTARPFAVVTGASRGIGLELARQFAAHGYDLLITSTGGPPLAEAARELERLGARTWTVAADLRDYDGVEALHRAVVATGRPLDAIALNAGVGLGGDFVRDTDLRDELDLIALNVTSTVHLAKRVLPAMVARGQGRVLVTASIESFTPGPFQAAYAASKAFIFSFALALRNELKGTGVTITALLPGPTDTGIFSRAGMDDTLVGMAPKDDPATVARQGFAALLAGEGQISAGSPVSKAMGAAVKVFPASVNAALNRFVSRPRSDREQPEREG